MADFPELIEALEQVPSAARPSLLATVVAARDPAYHAGGIRILVLPDGMSLATSSVGALQQHLVARAESLARRGAPALVSYELGPGAGEGPGCGYHGRLDVLLEPVPPGSVPASLRFAAECRRRGMPGVAGTVFRTEGTISLAVGDRFFLREGDELTGNLTNNELVFAFLEDARAVLSERRSDVLSFGVPGGAAEIFLEYVDAAPRTTPSLSLPSGEE